MTNEIAYGTHTTARVRYGLRLFIRYGTARSRANGSVPMLWKGPQTWTANTTTQENEEKKESSLVSWKKEVGKGDYVHVVFWPEIYYTSLLLMFVFLALFF